MGANRFARIIGDSCMIEYPKVCCAKTNTALKSGDLAVGVSYQQSGIDSNDKNARWGEDEWTDQP
jgi:hypothetical protein